MKLPGIRVKGIEGFESGQIPIPNVMAQSQALAGITEEVGQLAAEIHRQQVNTDLASATGAAAQELSALRAKLEASRTIPVDEIPDEIEYEAETTILNDRGEAIPVDNPFVFTHDIADQWWELKSEEILQNYASRIRDERAQKRFVGDMRERYVAPGTMAIARTSIEKSRAHNQATAQIAIQEVLASDAPAEVREAQAKEIIARQAINGADPLWVANNVSAIGPKIDQIDVQNQILRAQSKDELDMIEEEMWSNGNRMTPEQMRTLSAEMDKRRNDFDTERQQRHEEGGARATSMFFEGDLSIGLLNNMLENDDVDRPTAMTLYNALTQGSTTKASNEFALSDWREEIIKLPYTGARVTVSEKGAFLKRQIQLAAMGLGPNGQPLPDGPKLSGTDAAKLIQEVDQKVEAALESPAYDNAWGMVKMATGVTVDPTTGFLYGNQPNKNAAIAFKQALDTYMNIYGADADPIGFFNQNRQAFDPSMFEDPANREFVDFFPAAKRFMTEDEEGTLTFPPEQQAAFRQWLTEAVAAGTISEQEAERVAAQYLAFYLGQGVAPNNGELALEPDHPLYRQFEQWVQH